MRDVADSPTLQGDRVVAKFGSQRKARSYFVMPVDNGNIIVQADGCIGILNPETGHGRYTTKGGYFPHLAMAKPFDFGMEFVAKVLEAIEEMGVRKHVVTAF